jgi:pimeloyl-ACP methyl ester carboxylesterase
MLSSRGKAEFLLEVRQFGGSSMSKTIVLIHGAWLTGRAWEKFQGRFESKGYTVHAPSWPYDDRPVEELQTSPHPELAHLGVKAIVDHYAAFIQSLPESPIIMGHSFGGLFTQLLLDRGLGAAGVAISPGAPRGIIVAPQTLVSALPVFTAWNGWNRTLTMTFEAFCANFANGLPASEQKAAYMRYIVPTPGRIYYEGAIGIGTGIDWTNPERAPLLLTAAEFDRIVATSMVKQNFNKAKSKNPNTTDYHFFAGRSHFLCGEPGWEEVADTVIGWAEKNQRKG